MFNLNLTIKYFYPIFLLIFSLNSKTYAEEPASSPIPVENLKKTKKQKKHPVCVGDISLLTDLENKQSELDLRTKELNKREQELNQKEKSVLESLEQLKQTQASIKKDQELQKKDKQEKIAKMIETLEVMSPKSSAKMLSELEESLSVAVLIQMNTQKLSKILGLMDPAKASRLSEKMVGLNSNRKGGDLANSIDRNAATADDSKKDRK